MLKVKNSLLAKISAIVLVVALILGTVPMELLSVNAAIVERGSVTTIAEVGGEVDSTDPMNVQVKYEGEIVIARLGADEEKGRETEGWYVGALMTVPNGIDYDFVQYTNGDEVTTSLASLGNVESFYMWQSVKKNDYDAAAGGVLTYTWEFDWNTQSDGPKQNVVFSIDTSKATLSDEDKVAPTISTPVVNPTTWTNGDVEVSGTVNDNFSGVKAVYYKKAGTDTAQTATLTGNTYSFTIGAESYEGEYVVWCEDNKGNKSDEVIASVKMDNEKCVVATGKASCGEWTSQGVTISGTVTDMTSGVASVSWRKTDESANGEATFNVDSYSFDVPAQDYKGDYIITCKDKAGNESLEFTVPVQMDITAPVIQEPAATPDTWTNGQVVIRGEVSDNLSGVASVIYRKANSTEEKVATLDASAKTYTITLDADDYEGNYVIYCEDNAGIKSTEKEVFVRMDNIAPSDTTVELGNSVWEKIVDVFTFKLFFNNEQKLTVNTKDNRSGIKTIEWTEINVAGVTTLTEDSVENATGWTSIYNGDDKKLEGEAETKIASTPEKNVVVCVRVTDFAGNMSYVTTDGLIFDTTKPAPALTNNKLILPETEANESVWASGRPLYGIEEVGEDGKVVFDVKVTEATVDGVLQSGLQTVTYEINAKDRADDESYVATETGTLYTWDGVEALKTVYDSTANADAKISVDAAKFNYNYVDLTVKVVDNAGNETTETYEFAIDITAPAIEISYDNNKFVGYEGDGGRGYFDDERTLTVTYMERSENWNQKVANDVLAQTVAKDVAGEDVTYEIKWEDTKGTTSDNDVHRATIEFVDEVHYNVEKPAFTDVAGNEATLAEAEGTKYPYVFSIDKVDENDSTATIELMEQSWIEKFLNTITFGKLFTNVDEEVKVTVGDDFAGIKEIKYIEKTYAEGKQEIEITEEEVKAYEEWKEATVITKDEDKVLAEELPETITKTPDKNVVVFVRVIDYAGYDRVFSTDGVIVDTTVPAPALPGNKVVLPEVEATATVEKSGRPLYGIAEVGEDGKVIFDVKVTEATVDGVLQSGLQTVTYEINAKDRADDESYVATETGTLYTWDGVEALKTVYDSTANADAKISVDAAKFNYNYVDLTVKVVDNAGNEATETYEFAIDITAPTIEIGYDNNKFVGYEGEGGRGYFDAERTLTVTYTERSENWNQKAANDVLANTVAKDVEDKDVAYEIKWEDTKGTASDKDVHTATIEFADEVHYNIEKPVFTDTAGNEATLTEAEGTKYPYVFSIDKPDKDDSNGILTAMKNSWVNEFFDTITFGIFDLFSNENETVEIEVLDDFSGIYKVEYIEKAYDKGVQVIESEGKNVPEYEEWSKAITFDFNEDKKLNPDIEQQTITIEEDSAKNVVVYIRVTDYAGYVKYYSTEGLIFDTIDPVGGLDNKVILPETTEHEVKNPEVNKENPRPLYGIAEVGEDGQVVFDVKVTEETVDGVLQSGIQSVTYEIKAKDRAGDPDYKATETGELYVWDKVEALKTVYDSTSDADAKVSVDAAKFNYNYVDLTVKVVDNAGNETTETYEFAIDIIAPTVSIDYVDEDADTTAKDVFENGENTIYGCYTNARQAKITYTERTENWNRPSNTEIVTALDITGTEMEHGVAYEIDWDDQEGSTSNEDTHVATVTFHAEKDDTTKYKDARYDINTTCKDAAGNASLETITDEQDEYPFRFIIDTVSPEINVEDIKYSEHVIDKVINALTFNYYNNNVNVTVRMKDMTSGVKLFDYEGLLDSNISNKNKEVIKTIIETQDIKALTAEGTTDQLTGEFEVNFSIPKEALTELNSFRGTVKVNAFDYCGNSTEVHDTTRLVVDKIAPKGEVTFDAPVKEADGVSYYDGSFTATIVIDEANFYAEDVDIRVNDTRVYPSDWTQNGDVWTSHVSFTEENDYVLKVNYTDRSGNVMTSYESNQKTLDTTEPVITVTNLNHESANNDETIGFVLTVTDKNMALADVKPQVTAVIRKGDNSSNYTYETITIDLGAPSVSTNANGETVYTYVVNNLEIDGYYSIVCSATDHANHTVSNIGVSGENGQSSAVETMNFSVNREGSVFWIETEHTNKYTDETFKDELDGAYANDQVTVKLHEINVDKVDDSAADDKRTVFTLNDGSESNTIQLVEKVNGTGNYERNVELGQGGWYKTTYTLDNDQFKNDGTYSLNIITYDKAENSNVNTKSEEGTIKFVVDRTNPVITSNVKNEQSIKENEYTVEFKVADVNLDPATVVVKLDGKEIKCKEVSTGTYQFTLDEAQWANFPRLSQNFEIEAKDLAGNSAEMYERDDITVTDDVFIQAAAYMINHPLLLGLSATGLVAVVGFFIFFIILKRRKEEQE